MPALDSQKRRVSIQQQAPRHRQYAPRVVATINPEAPQFAIALILQRIAQIQTRYGTGAYLFIDDTMQAYVLHDEHTATQPWLRQHFTWLVGFYSRAKLAGVPWLTATPEGLAEDIGEHLRGVCA